MTLWDGHAVGTKSVFLEFALHNGAVSLAADVEPDDETLPIKIRVELGVRPDHEVIFLQGKIYPSVDTWRVDRAQEGTIAQPWPAGTPLVLLPADAEPTGETTLNLAHPLASNADQIDLQGCFRRWKIDAEIMHEAQLRGEGGANSVIFRFDRVLRGREGTVQADHAAGSTVTILAPGES